MRSPDNLTGRYILRGQEPVEEPDLHKWAQWMEESTRRIAWDEFSAKETAWPPSKPHKWTKRKKGEVQVSTVFLGLDHSFSSDPASRPVLFETIIFGLKFGDGDDEPMWRYHTWEAAEKGHETIVACLKSGGDPNKLTIPQG